MDFEILTPNYNDKGESVNDGSIFNHLIALTYPLELILQNTGDVKAEVGAKCQQTVEEQHYKAVIRCGKKKITERMDHYFFFHLFCHQ